MWLLPAEMRREMFLHIVFLSGKTSEGSRHAIILILASLGWMGS